ncbi:hypothetical protein MHPYR_180110 [uncultured Mycobacterium sp.]|uniref:Clp R domain-containing protein n=1 Tax=uncultured Mycobacterium sp. TaxID=171292 RepID=A0A1Y5P5D9_9MYCO|nr:hypothetical protein MHPYR_180110 [uncultured Mycobacterium sp.]
MTNIRETALRMAINHSARSADIVDIIATAEAFEKYLAGGYPTTAPAEDSASDKTKATLPLLDFMHPGGFIGRESQERLSNESRALIRRALTEALQLGQSRIQPEHVLLALTKNDGLAGAALIELGGTEKAVRKAVIRRIAADR